MSSNIGRWKCVGRLITLIEFFFPEPLLDVSTSCPLTEKWAKTLSSVTVSFHFWGRKLPLLSQWSMMHVLRQQVVPQHRHKCYDTLLCKCQSHPIKCSSDAIAHKGFPPIKFWVCYQFSFLFFLLLRRHFINKCVVHTRPCSTLTDRTHELLQ